MSPQPALAEWRDYALIRSSKSIPEASFMATFLLAKLGPSGRATPPFSGHCLPCYPDGSESGAPDERRFCARWGGSGVEGGLRLHFAPAPRNRTIP